MKNKDDTIDFKIFINNFSKDNKDNIKDDNIEKILDNDHLWNKVKKEKKGDKEKYENLCNLICDLSLHYAQIKFSKNYSKYPSCWIVIKQAITGYKASKGKYSHYLSKILRNYFHQLQNEESSVKRIPKTIKKIIRILRASIHSYYDDPESTLTAIQTFQYYTSSFQQMMNRLKKANSYADDSFLETMISLVELPFSTQDSHSNAKYTHTKYTISQIRAAIKEMNIQKLTLEEYSSYNHNYKNKHNIENIEESLIISLPIIEKQYISETHTNQEIIAIFLSSTFGLYLNAKDNSSLLSHFQECSYCNRGILKAMAKRDKPLTLKEIAKLTHKQASSISKTINAFQKKLRMLIEKSHELDCLAQWL